MFNLMASACCRLFSRPCFRVYGKGRAESKWRQIDVYAISIRDMDSRWPGPFFRGTCITWCASAVAVGWDFAETLLREQLKNPVSREHPLGVCGGRLRDWKRRLAAGGTEWYSASEVMAHEIGHTYQARRLSWLYLPTGLLFTLWREGEGWVHFFENQASEQGLFGGIVNGSVSDELWQRVGRTHFC
jgi:hypothetical protein